MLVMSSVVTGSGEVFGAFLKFPSVPSLARYWHDKALPEDAPEVRRVYPKDFPGEPFKPWPISDAELAEKLAA